ncbi:hypothetical protein GEMRC1_007136 [Eukaryota sp. GEM-RC1]
MSYRKIPTCSVYSPSKSKNLNNPIEKKISHQVLYKTEMCRLLLENGHCHFGNNCNFAHDPKELRSKLCHPRFKTEKCRSFHEQGYCPYGARCRFSHHIPGHRDSTSSKCPSLCLSNGSSLIVLPDPRTDFHFQMLTFPKNEIKRLPVFRAVCQQVSDYCRII